MFAVSKIVQRLPFQPDGSDEMGDDVKEWGDPEDVGIWFFDPGGSIETGDPGHDRVITTPALYGPHGLPFRAKDKCVVDGVPHLVEGHARHWDFPGMNVSGSVVKLKLVEG